MQAIAFPCNFQASGNEVCDFIATVSDETYHSIGGNYYISSWICNVSSDLRITFLPL